MHEILQKEIALYEKRTPKSAAAHKKAEKRIPLGVASNYRAYDPYPIFVAEGHGSKQLSGRNVRIGAKSARSPIAAVWPEVLVLRGESR